MIILRLRFGVLFFMLTTVSASAAETVDFNLYCSGTKSSGLLKKMESVFSEELRISISTGEWCKSTCFYVNKIKNVSFNEIVLDNKEDGTGWNKEYIDRRLGTYSQDLFFALSADKFRRYATCEKRPFSGFPKRKF